MKGASLARTTRSIVYSTPVSDQGTFTPVGAQGRFHGTPLKKTLSHRFLFRVISILAKILKTTFPKKFFKEIWLKVGEHK